jgi:4-amino-4-deoxy-L-arabinose transferase-like glycosyltransferase
MIKLTKRLDKWLHSHLILLLALLLLIVLRIPNFFEPYWYGDEAIYLTIGNALRSGETLYAEIVDHKTPLIYLFAMVPSQMGFRLLMLLWMTATTTTLYAISQKFLKNKLALIGTVFSFVILTSLPWFEGNIPNGELFVMGFILFGAWFLTNTKMFSFFLEERKTFPSKIQPLQLYLAGFMFGLAILTKVPAVFDVVGWLTLLWFTLSNNSPVIDKNQTYKKWLKLFWRVLLNVVVIGLGVISPILISIIYFILIGAGPDYLQFGLLYNFHYTQNWGLPFNHPVLLNLFTLPGKVMIAAIIYLILTLKKKIFQPSYQLIAGWFILALVASLLSNRPYPHYFQQIMPPLTLLLGITLEELLSKKDQAYKRIMTTIFSGLLISMSAAALILLDFSAYPTLSYYQRFYQLISKKITFPEYRQTFDSFMKDNYEAAEIIQKSGAEEIFIWGTNPMLYAMTKTNPTGKFTVSFHVKDIGVYDETISSVYQKKPLFIVVMNNESEELPGLREYLENNYTINSNFTHFKLWKRLPDSLSFGY